MENELVRLVERYSLVGTTFLLMRDLFLKEKKREDWKKKKLMKKKQKRETYLNEKEQ